MLKKQYLGLICATAVSFGVQAVPVPIDLNTWNQQGSAANGNWNVSADGSSVLQTINGEPTFFVSPDDLFNTTINGTFGVETTSDDDYIGFVFGYQSPLSANSDPTNDYDFLLFDWKQGDQSFGGQFANEGFSLNRVNGTISNVLPSFWGHNDSTEFDVLATDFGNDRGWADNTVYDFELLFQSNRIKIDIAGGAFGTGETIFDINGSFQSGKFGFYNYSQQQVRYVGFTEQATPPPPPPTPGPTPANAPATSMLAAGMLALVLYRRKTR